MSTQLEPATRLQRKSYVQSLVALRAADRLSRKLHVGEWVEEAAVPVTIAFAEATSAPRLPLSFCGRLRYG